MQKKVSYLALCLSVLPTSLRSAAQQVPNMITGAPFTALRTLTATSPSRVTVSTGTVARRSDGSTYIEMRSNSSNPRSGAGIVVITDVTQHRTIQLLVADHLYTVMPNPELKANALPSGYAEHYMQQEGPEGTKRTVGEWEITTLSQRQIDGVNTIGTSQVNAEGRSFERWYSPVLDLNIESKNRNPSPPNVYEADTQFREIRLGEPDAKLFEVPEGYTEIKPSSTRRSPGAGVSPDVKP
jgi:hypothetical protein